MGLKLQMDCGANLEAGLFVGRKRRKGTNYGTGNLLRHALRHKENNDIKKGASFSLTP